MFNTEPRSTTIPNTPSQPASQIGSSEQPPSTTSPTTRAINLMTLALCGIPVGTRLESGWQHKTCVHIKITNRAQFSGATLDNRWMVILLILFILWPIVGRNNQITKKYFKFQSQTNKTFSTCLALQIHFPI